MAAKHTEDSAAARIVTTKFVQVFKMVNNSYQSQGRCGSAIIYEEESYKLLLYRDKNTHLTINLIDKDFNFQILQKNYCAFYDKDQCIWSMLFKTLDDLEEFAFEIIKCRWFSMKPPFSRKVVLSQQLTCSDDKLKVAEDQKQVGITYSVYPLEHSSHPNQKNQKLERTEIAVKNSFWSRHIAGISVNSKFSLAMDISMMEEFKLPRPQLAVCQSKWFPVIVVLTVEHTIVRDDPPSLPELDDLFPASLPGLEGLGGEIPKTVPAEDCLPALPSIKNLTPSPAKDNLTAVSSVSDVTGDSEIESGAPGSDGSGSSAQTYTQRTRRGDLMSRVARMGQPLPYHLPKPKQRSDSEDTEEECYKSGSRGSMRLSGSSKSGNRMPFSTNSPNNKQSSNSIDIEYPVVEASKASTTIIPPHSIIAPSYLFNSPSESQLQFNMFCSEVRTTNSELRMNLNRVYDKVDSLASRIEANEQNSNSNVASTLERILLHEEQIKDQLEKVISSLKSSNLTSHDKSDGDKATSDSDEVTRLREENAYLKQKCQAQSDVVQNARIANRDQMVMIESLQAQLANHDVRFSELQEKIQTLLQEKNDIEASMSLAKQTISDLQSSVKEKQATIDRLELSLRKSEKNCVEEVRRSLREVLDPKVMIGEHVRRVMSLVYKHIQSQFKPPKHYDAVFIHSVFADTMKGIMLEYLQVRQEALPGRVNQTMHSQSSNSLQQPASQRPVAANTPETPVAMQNPLTSKSSSQSINGRMVPSTVDFTKVGENPLLGEQPVVKREEISIRENTVKSEVIPVENVQEDRVNGSAKKESEANGETLPSDVRFSETPADPNSGENPFTLPVGSSSPSSSSHTNSGYCQLPKPPPPPLFDEDEGDDWLLK